MAVVDVCQYKRESETWCMWGYYDKVDPKYVFSCCIAVILSWYRYRYWSWVMIHCRIPLLDDPRIVVNVAWGGEYILLAPRVEEMRKRTRSSGSCSEWVSSFFFAFFSFCLAFLNVRTWDCVRVGSCSPTHVLDDCICHHSSVDVFFSVCFPFFFAILSRSLVLRYLYWSEGVVGRKVLVSSLLIQYDVCRLGWWQCVWIRTDFMYGMVFRRSWFSVLEEGFSILWYGVIHRRAADVCDRRRWLSDWLIDRVIDWESLSLGCVFCFVFFPFMRSSFPCFFF